jgi:hypothetical protein
MAQRSTAKKATKKKATPKKAPAKNNSLDSVEISEKSENVGGYAVESVFVSVGRKINMGNYESIDINSGITLRQKSNLNQTPEERASAKEMMYEEAWDTVVGEINATASKIMENKHGK